MAHRIADEIGKVIEKVSSSISGFEYRDGQLSFMRTLARLLDPSFDTQSAKHFLGELPTGSGKSIGALLPCIGYINHINKDRAKDERIKIVYASSTVALQHQLLKDVSLLEKAGVKTKSHVVVGKGRFICRKLAEISIQPNSEQIDIFGGAINGDYGESERGINEQDAIKETEKTKIKQALKQLKEGVWSGILDELDSRLAIDAAAWRKIKVDSNICSSNCQYFCRGCPFIRSRQEAESADLLITNHSMVFADLDLNNVLPKPEASLMVFDEGHHCVDNFHATEEKICSFFEMTKLFNKQNKQVNHAINFVGSKTGVVANVDSYFGSAKQLLDDVIQLLDQFFQRWLTTQSIAKSSGVTWILESDVITRIGLKAALKALSDQTIPLAMSLSELLNAVKECNKDLPAAPLTLIAQAHETLEKANDLMKLFVKESEENIAMWYERNNLEIPSHASLFAARINVSKQMLKRLWERCHHAIVMSATLSTQGNFNQFFHESGLPSNITITEQYSSPYVDAFHNSSLHLYPNMADVDWRNETAHSLEIVNETMEFMQYHRAGLLIFVSRRQMEEVVSLLPNALKDIALVQQSASKNQLIAEHRQRIDDGKSSLLIGLASMSEGLDLKGSYLTFVGIAKLSFGASQSPRLLAESKLIETKGGSSFQMLTLPKAELALQQSVGRLIRSISDTGEVAIFDNRLVKKRYGITLLSRLPPFYRVINQGRQYAFQDNK